MLMCQAAGADASGLRDFQDHFSLAIRRSTFRPCDLHQRDEIEQLHSISGVAQILESVDHILISDADDFSNLPALGLVLLLPVELFDQFLILLAKIFLLEPAFAFSKDVSIGHITSSETVGSRQFA